MAFCKQIRAVSPHTVTQTRRSSDEFLGQVGERTSLWQRQMVLGPTPEFCSLDDDDLDTGSVVVTRLRKVASRGM